MKILEFSNEVKANDAYSAIIDENFKEYCSIEEIIDDTLMDEFLQICSEEIKRTIITQFGLSQFFDYFKDGGNIATLHNAKKGIFPDKEIERQFKEIYDRTNYDQKLSLIRKEKFKKDSDVKSYLTNKKIKKDGSTHADHIISAKEIHLNDDARLYMSKEHRSEFSQSDDNIEFLEGNINQSKNSKDLLEWKDTIRRDNAKTNQEHFNIDGEAAKKYHRNAHNVLKKEIRNQKIRAIGSTGMNQALNMGKKQVIGMFIYEVIDFFFIMSFDLIDSWKESLTINEKVSAFKEILLDSINITIIKFEGLKSNIIQTFLMGLSSGFIANLLTFLINHVLTTFKSMGRVLNDSIYGLMRAFKLMINRPGDMSFEEASKEATKIVAAAITASTGIILTESIRNFLLTTPLSPLSNEIAIIIAGTITAIFTALVLYLMDNYRQVIRKISNEMNLIMKYSKITKEEIEQAYLKTLNEVDEIYNEILFVILEEYKDLDKLSSLAYDFNLLASETFDNSIKYAEHSGVNKDDILYSASDIDDFFLK